MHNPYWQEIQAFLRDEIAWEYEHRWEPQWQSVSWRDLTLISPQQRAQLRNRHDLCSLYSWSIPDPCSLEFVARHLGPTAVEIGAGSGYYAYCLAQLGTEVICYDIAPPHRASNNHWHSPRLGLYQGLSNERRSVWREIYYGSHTKAARYSCPLLLCWPPFADDMAAKALKAYRGHTLVYIGEGSGGCCANDTFFRALEKHWELIDVHRPIQWSGIHDLIEVYHRKTS